MFIFEKTIYMRVFGLLLSLALLSSCGDSKRSATSSTSATSANQTIGADSGAIKPVTQSKKERFTLTEENAIPFFFEYEKALVENHLKFETSLGNFTVRLFENVPYHRANAIYLAKNHYFDGTLFHRVVKGFIIQGGNADNPEVAAKRKAIGRYLLPPDTNKGHKHHRGVISMPSSDIDNPHKLASPFEFFIVVTEPGSYHLDGSYTAFGEVTEGMEVVDKINSVAVDSGDWPMQNVYIQKVTAFTD